VPPESTILSNYCRPNTSHEPPTASSYAYRAICCYRTCTGDWAVTKSSPSHLHTSLLVLDTLCGVSHLVGDVSQLVSDILLHDALQMSDGRRTRAACSAPVKWRRHRRGAAQALQNLSQVHKSWQYLPACNICAQHVPVKAQTLEAWWEICTQ
jgi:hypothetical protein